MSEKFKKGKKVQPEDRLEHFLTYVVKHDGCWEWTGAVDKDGYGKYTWPEVTWRANIAAYILFHGPIEVGLLVRHTCDNPPCCNPDHLILGTPKDNAQDCVERNRNSKLNRESCPKGHPWDENNTRRAKGGHRVCKQCNIDSCRKDRRAKGAVDVEIFCLNGHVRAEVGFYIVRGQKYCKACKSASDKRYWESKKCQVI